MDSEQRTTPIVEAWLKGTSDIPFGTEMGVRRVRSRVRHTRQRGRWWRLPLVRRTPASAPGIQSVEFQPTSTGATQGHTPAAIARFQPVLNATKLVVASAIVALMGGFLLSGMLTQSGDDGAPGAVSPSPTADLLSTLDIEDVTLGVQRLTVDGVGRNLRGLRAVDYGASGPVWLTRDDGRVFRLDVAGNTKIDVQQQPTRVSSLPDGSIVMVAGREAYLIDPTPAGADGAAAPAAAISISPELPSHIRTPTALAGAADGSVWASWTAGSTINPRDTRVLRYLDGEWQDLSGADGLGGLIDLVSADFYVCDITDTSDGAVYVGFCGGGGWGFGGGGLFRYLDGSWERVPVFAEMGRTDILVSDLLSLASGPDGTLWAVAMTTTSRIAEGVAAGDWSVVDEQTPGPDRLQHGPALLRLQDGRWSAYAWHDIEPDTQRVPWQWDLFDVSAVDPDGVLWFGSVVMNRSKVKLGSYDGDEVRWYPKVTGARDIEIGPDGRPWVAAADGIYVIDRAETESETEGRDAD
jgi:hypothetical protein